MERVDLDFARTNQVLFQPNDDVELTLLTKNIDNLIVKIFEINSENYYKRYRKEIDTDINLQYCDIPASEIQKARAKGEKVDLEWAL